jgi:ribonuclease HII
MMERYAEEYPGYGWDKNAGYPTVLHRQGIIKFGLTPLHRKSFKHLPDQLDFDF